MAYHIVRQGETIPSIAAAHDIDDWNVIFGHSGNSNLRARRSPTVLAPDDEVWMPEELIYFGAAATANSNVFQLTPTAPFFRISLRPTPFRGRFLIGWFYELEVGDATFSGTIPDTGRVEHDVERAACKGTLRLCMREADTTWLYEMPILIGHLDPIELPSGVLERLLNLGFLARRMNPPQLETPAARVALADFQRAQRLPATGEADGRTRARLVEVHGA